MIVGLRGKIRAIFSDNLHLDVNGVIYEIFIPTRDIQNLMINTQIELKIAHIFRETPNQQILFGFLNEDTRTFFLELINISGIGAKTALSILSHISEYELLMIIDNNDEQALTRIPKIGIKSARKLLNELSLIRNRLKISHSQNINRDSNNSEKYIAIQALETLGFSRDEVVKTVSAINNSQFSNHKDIIKEALKSLNKFGN